MRQRAAAPARPAARDSVHAAPAPRPTLISPSTAAPESVVEGEPLPLLRPGAPAAPDTAEQRRSARAREFVQAGLALERQGDPAAAIASYRNAVMLDSRVRTAYGRMGFLFLGQGEYEQAKACFAAELNNDPSNFEVGRALGEVLARTGDHKRAIQELELLTRRRPDDAPTWRTLGFAYAGASRKREAESALRRAIRLAPGDAIAHRDLGAVLAADGRVAEARAEYARAARLSPRDPSIPLNLGNLERRAGRLEAALEDYRRAEALDSTFAFALQGQAQVLTEVGRDHEAGDAYRRWLRVRPDDHNARLEAVRLYDRLGRPDVSLEIARNGVRASPRSPDAHLILGMALSGSGEARAALGELRRAESLFTTAADRARADALVMALRMSAPDSLRVLFEADSVEHARRAGAPPPWKRTP